jgi:hypothetical protein
MRGFDDELMGMVVADARGEATIEVSRQLRSEETVCLWVGALEVKIREAKERLEGRQRSTAERLRQENSDVQALLRQEQLSWEARHLRYLRCLKDRLSEAHALVASYQHIRAEAERAEREERRRRHAERVNTEGRLTALRRAIDTHRDAVLEADGQPREADLVLWDTLDDNWGTVAAHKDRAARIPALDYTNVSE